MGSPAEIETSVTVFIDDVPMVQQAQAFTNIPTRPVMTIPAAGAKFIRFWTFVLV